MNTIQLVLTTPQGDDIGILPITSVQLTQATTDGTVPSDVHEQMTAFYSIITDTLAQEGLQTTLDTIGFQLAVSRSLLRQLGNAEIVIELPVCEIVSASEPFDTIPATDMDDLFDVDDLFLSGSATDVKGGA